MYLDPFKQQLGADLIEQVHQVRRYRNWVAHGRRSDRPNALDPLTAYERLQRFLDRLTEMAATTAIDLAPS